MIKSQYTCDKCGAVEVSDRYKKPDGWNTITYSVQKNENIEKSVCPKCSKELGIERKLAHIDTTYNRSIGERLLDIITEIVQGEIK